MPTSQPQDRHAVFVSYAREDDRDGRVSALVDALGEELGPDAVFFDRQTIGSMDDWQDRIHAGLKSARAMLAVVSPAFFNSRWCRLEWQRFRDHERALRLPGNGILPVYFRTSGEFDRAKDGDDTDQWAADLARRSIWDIRDRELDVLRGELAGHVEQILDRIEQVRLSLAPRSTIPRPPEIFVGRDEQLRRLREMLTFGCLGAITAVHGIGGMGKTALAFQYAQVSAADYPGGRFLVSTFGTSDLRVPIVNLASHLDIQLTPAEQRDLEAGFARVSTALQNRPRSLLLLDNVDNPDLLTPDHVAAALPHGQNVHVLITTRLEPQKLRGLECLALDRLEEDEGVDLLDRHRPIADETERQAARGIVGRLGGWTLAVEVVAVHLEQNPEISCADYLARLQSEGLEALDAAVEDDLVSLSLHCKQLLGELIAPTLDSLSAAEHRALEYAAQLPPDRVPLPWLRELLAEQFPEETQEPKRGYPDPWQRLLRRLRGLRLLGDEKDDDDPRLTRMHRLRQEIVLARTDAAARTAQRAEITQHAEGRAEFVWDGWVDRDNRWEIDPLVDYALMLIDAEDPAGAEIGNWVHQPLELLGRFAEDCDLLRRAIAIQEKALGADDPKLAISYSNLAAVERDLGNLSEARDLLRQAMAIQEKALRPGHPNLAISYSNLALVEKALDNLSRARDLLRRATAIQKKALKPDHPNLAISYSNLALVEKDLGNLPRARDLLRQAIAIQEKAFEPDHPNLAVSYSNLATVEQDLGNPSKARDLLRRAITIQEKAFKPDHPNLATSYHNLAKVEADLGNQEEARRLMRRAYGILRAKLDEDHPSTQKSREWLAEHDPEFE